MTSELEQEFFSVFGIKPQWKDKRVKSIKTYYTEEQAQYLRKTTKNRNIQLCYPDITAEKLLEMIIIRATNYKNGTVIELEPDSNIEDLKYEVLRHFIDYRGNFDKHQIQQLFEVEK